MRNWSFVLPVKNEYELMKRTFTPALNLQPSEVVLCLDEPPPKKIISYARKKTQAYGIPLNIITVTKDPPWRFHQAHVRREGYLATQYDFILTADVDIILKRNVLEGLRHIGRDNIAMVSFAKESLPYSPTSFFRCMSKKITHRLHPSGFSGLYWLFKPYYLNILPLDTIKAISNGEDTLLKHLIDDSDLYRRIHFKDVGGFDLRPANEALTTSQFRRGVWFSQKEYNSRKVGLRRTMIQSLLYLEPHVLRGFVWGLAHPELVGTLPPSFDGYLTF